MLRKLKLVLNQQKNSNNIIGNGITKGTNEVNTVLLIHQLKTFPNNRKLSDRFRKIFSKY
jgi:hypothetical protein